MSRPLRFSLRLAVLALLSSLPVLSSVLVLSRPALAHPGGPDDLPSQLRHVLTNPDHIAALAGLGVLGVGLLIIVWRSRSPSAPADASRSQRPLIDR
jgi:hydrogenase/urease accessory protein HupE